MFRRCPVLLINLLTARHGCMRSADTYYPHTCMHARYMRSNTRYMRYLLTFAPRIDASPSSPSPLSHRPVLPDYMPHPSTLPHNHPFLPTPFTQRRFHHITTHIKPIQRARSTTPPPPTRRTRPAQTRPCVGSSCRMGRWGTRRIRILGRLRMIG